MHAGGRADCVFSASRAVVNGLLQAHWALCCGTIIVYYILVGVGYKLYESQFLSTYHGFIFIRAPSRAYSCAHWAAKITGWHVCKNPDRTRSRLVFSRATVERARRKLQAPRLYQPCVHDDSR